MRCKILAPSLVGLLQNSVDDCRLYSVRDDLRLSPSQQVAQAGATHYERLLEGGSKNLVLVCT